jgi:hypothetical protein
MGEVLKTSFQLQKYDNPVTWISGKIAWLNSLAVQSWTWIF